MIEFKKLAGAALLLTLFCGLVAQTASAATCDENNLWSYNDVCYPTRAAAEFALKNPTNSNGARLNGDWRYFYEFKEQIGDQYVYHLPPQPHLPSPSWRTQMPNGLFIFGFRGYLSPNLHTWFDVLAWAELNAALPTSARPDRIVSDDLVFRGAYSDANNYEHRVFSHNYTEVAVSRVDFSLDAIVFPKCADFETGVEDAWISRINHNIYKSTLTPNPTVLAAGWSNCTIDGVLWGAGGLPVIDIHEWEIGPCQTPYASDGTQCVSAAEDSIFFGLPYALETPPQDDSDPCNNESNPCNPANGVKSEFEIDYASAAESGLEFARYYNSGGSNNSDPHFQTGWRHTYSRRLDEEPDLKPHIRFSAPADQSSFYNSAAEACTSGWTELKDTVWSGDLSAATASFAGGNVCTISIGGSPVAYFPVRSARGWTGFTPPTGIKSITRPNGSTVRFEFDGANWINYLNPSLKLVQSGTDWIFTGTDDSQETYNSAGRLIQIQYRNGQTETLEYNLTAAQGGDDDSDTLDRVTGSFGHTISLTHDANGRLASITTPDGTVSYQHDVDDTALVGVTYVDNTTRQYLYEDINLPTHLTGIVDEKGDRFASWSYDGAGRAISSEHAGGKERVDFVYNADGTTTLTMANGAVRNYDFSTEQGNRLVSMLSGDVCSSCPGGDIAIKTYDANGFLDEAADWNGIITQTERNARGLTETLTEAKGTLDQRVTTTVWHPTFRLPTQITSPKNVTDFTYDANGNLETLTVSGGLLTRAWEFTYNASGQPLTIDGPRTDVTDVTTLVYHDCVTGAECGQLQSVTNALSQVTTYDGYDAAGRLSQMTDPNGLITAFAYDTRGNLLTVTQTPATGTPRVTTMSYDAASQLETMTTPDGLLLTYTYDAAHYLRSVTDNFGNRIDYDYDAMGNLKDEDTYDPGNVLKRALDYAYDLNNRLDTVTNGGFITDLTIDLVGNLTNELDPKLASTQHAYDSLNRLDQTIDALTGVIDYDYDAHNNITTITAPNGATTTYEYDELDNLTNEISPDRGTTTYTYDDAGNRVTELDARGKLTTYAYDALNRLTLVTLDAGGTIDYEYDIGTNAVGRLNRITDATGQTTWSYDNFGAVTQKIQTIGTVALSTGYTYDAGGKLLSVTLPSGKVVTYSYNVFLPNSVSVDGQAVLSGATYDPFGPVNAWTWGNGSFASRNFSLRGLLDSQTLAGDTRALGYDAAGQVMSMLDASLDVTFDYNLLGRLTDFVNNNGGGGGSPAGPMFSSTPVILADIQTAANETGNPPVTNPTPWLMTGVRNVAASSVQLALERAEVNTGSITVPETIGYIAIEGGASGSFSANSTTISYEAQTSADKIKGWQNGCYTTNFLSGFATPPTVVATINRHDSGEGGWVRRCSLSSSAIGLTIDEDQYRDSERRHNSTEAAGVAAFSQDFNAQFTDEIGTWGMEAATVVLAATTADPTFKQVNFRQIYTTPPIVVVLATNETSEPAAMRIRNVTTTGFQAVQVEPANADGVQGAMTLHYLAVEPGTHELPDGTRILAGSVSTTSQQHGTGVSGTESWENETFADWPGTGGGVSSPLPASQLFTYDPNGNRSSLTEDGTPYTYANLANSNRLLSTTGPTAKTYTYDASGNVTGDGLHAYLYDDRGRLVDVDAGAVTYAHNGQGQRVRKTTVSSGGGRGKKKKTTTTEVLFVYDEGGSLIGEYDAEGTPIQETVWFGGAPVAVLQGPDQHYVHTDQLGTPRVITDGNTIIWRWQSDPFGATAAQQDPDGDGTEFTYNLRFPGQYFDAETGLHYNYFRVYDPNTGRYLESDPVGLLAGLNTYGYASANPLINYDPYGLFCLSGLTRDLIIAGLSGAVGGAVQGGIAGGTSSAGLAAIPSAIFGGLVGLAAGIAGEYFGNTLLGGTAVGAVSGAVSASVTREGIGGIVGGAVGGAISGAPGGGIGAAAGGAIHAGKGVGRRLTGAVRSGKIGVIGGLVTELTSITLDSLIPDCDDKDTRSEPCEQP